MTDIRCRLVVLVFIIALAGCRQQGLSSADLRLELTASDMRVGETTLLLRVTDGDGTLISDPGALSVRGDMDHAGMAPVLAEADSAADGVFSLPFEWTMGGGWIVEATLTRPNGDVARETFSFEIHSEAADVDSMDMEHDEMPEMDHSDMSDVDHSATPGESSAAYLRIHNSGAADVTIIAASSAAAAEVAIHRTVLQGEMARMEAVDSLLIPAGEAVDLAPGGTHLMLIELTADLPPGGALTLRLESDSGDHYDLDVPVMNMLMGEPDDAVAIGDLVFSRRWARPAQAPGMNMRATPSG